ncbi:hypothetical protein Tco_0151564 [Tanacetum coccineum]
MYTTSITKTKAALCEIEWIEDMVPMLWSPTKVGNDKDALKGIKHWGEGRKLWHISQLNKFSKHNVYSTKKILGVKSVSVKKLHGYGNLEEIVLKRADRQFYKFKEGDFVDLHLNDIKDMLLLAVQHKLFHLTDSDIVDFIVALCMFTRSLVIKKRVEDLQLGADELYKFSDGTLKKVRDKLHQRIRDFCLEYNKEISRRKWTATDKKEVVKIRYSFPLSSQNRRDLPRDISLVRIEVLMYDEKRSKVRKGNNMRTKTELTLEQTQQGVSDEVLVSIEGVEELKRKVKIKGEKKEALLTFR